MPRRSAVLLTMLVAGVVWGQGDNLLRDVSADSLWRDGGFGAQISNRGSWEETFPTWFSIEDSTGRVIWLESVVVTLWPGVPDTIWFTNVGIRWPGVYTARCSVALAGDENPENDTASLQFVVPPYIDVGIAAIYWPKDTVVEGMEGRPAYEVANYGAETVDLWAWFSLGYSYAESLFVEGLAGNTGITMEFPTWCASPRGWIPMACSLLVVSPESLVCSPYQGSLYVRPAGAILEGEPGGEELRGQGTVCLGMLRLPGKHTATLLDIAGRKVMSLQPGQNDVRHVAPGVYFVRGPETEDGRPHTAVRKVVIQR